MALKESYDFSILENEAERIVTAELKRQLAEIEDESFCFCEDCVLDMAALALNSVKPLYRVSLLGTMYAQAAGEGEYHEEISRAVTSAIGKVHARPSHD